MEFKVALAFCALSSLVISSAHAVPRGMKLAAPTKIEKVGKELKLTFLLKCESDLALEWSSVVMVSNDEGDQAAAVGLVYSTDECEEGDKRTKHLLTVDPSHYGYSVEDTAEFVPMDLAKR